MKKIAVFASGGGTDFQSIIDANEREQFCEIAYLVASSLKSVQSNARKNTALQRLYLIKLALQTKPSSTIL